jgi:hypothetical protein
MRELSSCFDLCFAVDDLGYHEALDTVWFRGSLIARMLAAMGVEAFASVRPRGPGASCSVLTGEDD